MKKKDAKAEPKKEKIFTPGMKKALIVLLCIYFAVVAVIIAYSIWEKPPELSDPVKTPAATTGVDSETSNDGENQTDLEDNEGEALKTKRSDGIYTAAVVGRDAASGGTDTILVGRFDTNKHEIDVVSIPRDTLINIGWSGSAKKINAVYQGYENSGLEGIDGLKKYLATIMGFEVDCYAVIDVQAFVDIIDAMGGVYYDVPQDMRYKDPMQNLSIDVSKGYQLLNGYDAMGVFRFRNTYSGGDLQRIGVQQDFLMAIADQFLTLGNIPNLGKIIDILDQRVDTNLTAANMAYFARQFLKCDMESIEFHTAPVSGSYFGGVSFVSLNVDEWLDMVNETLNPYDEEITKYDVDILVANYDGSYVYSTSGYIAGGLESLNRSDGDAEEMVPAVGGEENTATQDGNEAGTGDGEVTAPETEPEAQAEDNGEAAQQNEETAAAPSAGTELSYTGNAAASEDDSELYDQLMEMLLLQMMMNSGISGLG